MNKALEEYIFGSTKYRFKWSPTENSEMRRYYDMITNSRLDGASIYDLLEPGTDLSEYEPLVKTLFQLISSEGTDPASRQKAEDNIQKYKSIQTHLRFDLVEVGPDGKEYPLSSTMGSKSGGERQTPFYGAILASLMKTTGSIRMRTAYAWWSLMKPLIKSIPAESKSALICFVKSDSSQSLPLPTTRHLILLHWWNAHGS